MTEQVPYNVNWYGGPSAEVDLYASKTGKKRSYRRRYTPAFRGTIRPPLDEVFFGDAIRTPIESGLNRFFEFVGSRDGTPAVLSGTKADAFSDPATATKAIQEAGSRLFVVTLPPYARADLRPSEMFVQIGMDEDLVAYPWELMFDGREFLCLKHYVGRFVNARKNIAAANQHERRWWKESIPQLSALVVVADCPCKRHNEMEYPKLQHARSEALQIAEVLADAGVDVTQIGLEDGMPATFSAVERQLESKHFHIIHYCGHARFDNKSPRDSSLILHDEDMPTTFVQDYFAQNRPILCFINACETAREDAGKDSFNVYGLARAFLDTGAYLLGSRWKVRDKAAAAFATTFYKSMLQEFKPIGQAVCEARRACKQHLEEWDFSWASYIYYGDPHLCFLREGVPVRKPASQVPPGHQPQPTGTAGQVQKRITAIRRPKTADDTGK